jgi:hypothetical protein
MTPRQAFPTSITLPLPQGAEIIGAGMISAQDELLVHPYQVLPGDTQDSLQLNLPAPRFFLEFYYNPFRVSGAEKRFTYTAPTTYPIEVLEVDVQQPLQATNFTLDPPSMERRTDTQGFTYHQSAYRNIRKGQTHTFTVSYTKAVATPSVPKQQQASQPPAKPSPPSNKTLLSLSILAGAALAFAVCAWLFRRSRPQHVPDASLPPQSTPTPDALVTLLQESTKTQNTPLTPPPQPQIRAVNFCTQCGRKILPDDRFCAECGKAIKR